VYFEFKVRGGVRYPNPKKGRVRNPNPKKRAGWEIHICKLGKITVILA
jgi:hypothetical protein